jgi:hypothetical protein
LKRIEKSIEKYEKELRDIQSRTLSKDLNIFGKNYYEKRSAELELITKNMRSEYQKGVVRITRYNSEINQVQEEFRKERQKLTLLQTTIDESRINALENALKDTNEELRMLGNMLGQETRIDQVYQKKIQILEALDQERILFQNYYIANKIANAAIENSYDRLKDQREELQDAVERMRTSIKNIGLNFSN